MNAAGNQGNNGGWLQLYQSIPVVTRLYTTACLLVTLATNFDFMSPFDLYLNPTLIFHRFQFWRLCTTFLFAGTVNFATVFNLLFTYRYSRILEETSFNHRSHDYFFMCVFMASLMLILAMSFTNLIFLEHSFTHALLYVWCRRNPHTPVLILGFLTFHAHQVPFVLIGLALLTGTPISADLLAIAVGHAYYFLEDVFPRQALGFRILKTPQILKVILGFPDLDDEDVSGGGGGDNLENNAVNVVDENNNVMNEGQGLNPDPL